ncbi:MAG: 2OG-Fe(II) oxygenase [Alphaproteobacteria bacterium]|nr:2OG-Fe(II) oxygenase [Alphaproteobacteria bacterium]
MVDPNIPLRRLRPGDPAPWFVAPTHTNPIFNFDTTAGRYVVVSLFGHAETPAGIAIGAFLAAHRRQFDDENCTFIGVTGRAEDHSRHLQERLPGIRWFQDPDGRIARAFKADADDQPAGVFPQTLVLDPALRVLFWVSLADPAAHAAILARILGLLPPIPSDKWSVGVAPALILPRVLEHDFCRRLIDHYEAVGGAPSGHMSTRDGRSVGVLDRSRKRRNDCLIEDADLRRGLQDRVASRLIPMIARAYQFQATRIERYIVACYDGAERGFFFHHRDNTTPATGHRRFAVTINLNAEEYEGGDLRFPEFGRATYRAPTGGAVVFSCTLLHEALPVTRGRRYATLPFLYDDRAAAVRDATRHLIDPVGPAPAPADEATAG